MTSNATPSYTLTSSPGKVLLAGGYLVLSPAYPGLVVGTDSRFYSLVKPGQGNGNGTQQTITIRSPQFTRAEWKFHVDVDRWSLTISQESAESESAGKSPFLCLALVYSLAIALQKAGRDKTSMALANGLDVWILADNDFYSQRTGDAATTTEYLASLPPFNPLNCTISKVHKTGLGSSAALTTSLVSALLIHLGAADRSLPSHDLAFLHNVSQLAHCAAQGKIGSGFDVSSAVWGSQIFRRFDARALSGLLDTIPRIGVEGDAANEPLSLTSLPDLLSPLDPLHPLWRPSPLSEKAETSDADGDGGAHPTAFEGLHSVQQQQQQRQRPGHDDVKQTTQPPRPSPLQLPPRISLLLADVDAGSNTPSLVGKVNEWKTRKPEWAAQLYSVLASSNQSLADALLSLTLAHDADPQRYHAELDTAADVRSKTWPAPSPEDDATSALTHLTSARNALRSIRAGMRQLGQLSKAPIEPDEMGRLIQAAIDGVDGVVGGGVPGAGGYDALYLLYIGQREGDHGALDDGKRRQIERVLLDAREPGLSVGILLSRAGNAKEGRDGDAHETGGLRVESIEDVRGLAERTEVTA